MNSQIEFLEFERFDKSKLWQIHQHYFQTIGLKAWKRGDVPYTGVSNFIEAYKKARFFVENIKESQTREKIRILEVGAGFGEFAKNFLLALQSICDDEKLDYFFRLEYHISDFSIKTIEELKASGRLADFEELIYYQELDVLNKNLQLKENSYDLILANYLLDQLPARVIAHSKGEFFEKYICIENPDLYYQKQIQNNFWFKQNRWLKALKKKVEFREINIDKEIPLSDLEILESCFRANKASTVVYSYGALKAIKNLSHLLKNTGVIICSDFNASTKPGIDKFEPCYYGNSIAQAVNFEFIYKYFAQSNNINELYKLKHFNQNSLGCQMALLYEDPIKPLHTLILTRPDFPYALKLGEIYQTVYQQNWLLRTLYRTLVEMQLSCYILALFILGFVIMGLIR